MLDKEKMVCFRMNKKEYEEIKRIAEENGYSLSKLLRKKLREVIEEIKYREKLKNKNYIIL